MQGLLFGAVSNSPTAAVHAAVTLASRSFSPDGVDTGRSGHWTGGVVRSLETDRTVFNEVKRVTGVIGGLQRPSARSQWRPDWYVNQSCFTSDNVL